MATGISPRSKACRKGIVVVGPVSLPTVGQSVATKRLVEELGQSNAAVTLVDLAVSRTGTPLRRKLRRAIYLTWYGWHVVSAAWRGAAMTYISVDASPGTVFTVLYTLAARIAGTRVILHHHSSSYLRNPTLAMRWLCRIAGRNTLHIAPCAAATVQLSTNYSRVQNTATLSNAFAIDPYLPASPTNRGTLVLGHLSNLTVAKGALTVIECFAELRARGEPVELHLAGPVWDEAAARALHEAQTRFGGALTYHGALDATGKRAFFAAIDVFLFPSMFKHELQPLVVLEALAAGVPVIAFEQLCLSRKLVDGCGVVVPRGSDFQTVAVLQVSAWLRDRAALHAAAAKARARFDELRVQSSVELAALLDVLSGKQQTPDAGCGPA